MGVWRNVKCFNYAETLLKHITYLWVKQKVGASVFYLNSQKLFLISWREAAE